MSYVIVIEDDLESASALAHFIKLLGYSVSVTYDMPPALELAKRKAPDLILMDVWYALSSEEFRYAIGEFRALSPDVKIVAMTCAELPQELAPLFTCVLKKPMEPEQVFALLQPQKHISTPKLIGNAGTTKKYHSFAATRIVKILFLAANPSDMSQLQLDKEIRDIDQAMRQAEYRDRFDIRQHWAVRVSDLQGYLLRHKPDIVHFSGHGSISNEIILENNLGKSIPVSNRALSHLFFTLKDNIRCVVLNACFSEPQAQSIAQHIDCVIGMSKAIDDNAAINFATAFYQALGYGRNIKTAFELGCVQIDLANLDKQDTPKLIAKIADPSTITFVGD